MLTDVNHNEPSTLTSEPEFMFGIDGIVYFAANDGDRGSELWRSDGTAEGTWILETNPGLQAGGPTQITISNNQMYFAAFNNSFGREIWKTDGTPTGTVLLKDITPGAAGIGPTDLTDMNGILYFAAGDAEHGRELWKSDGTSEGTVLVKDINGTASNSLSITSFSTMGNYFKHVNGKLFFTPDDGVHGKELWVSDGTEQGTVLVKDINPGVGSTVFYSVCAAGDLLFFIADDGTNGKALWKSDGTEAGTVIVKSLPGETSEPRNLVYFKDKVFFHTNDPVSGPGLWATDGTEPGTSMVKNVTFFSSPAIMGDQLYFRANEMHTDVQVWKSDGTEAGTMPVTSTGTTGPISPNGLVTAGNTLFFGAFNNEYYTSLWKSDGTAEGTVELAVPNAVSFTTTIKNMTSAGSLVFFSADDGISGFELWVSDGTVEGTRMVKDINKASVFFPTGLRMVGNSLMFINNQNANSYEVWKSDGTNAGTTLVKDISPGMASFQFRYTATAGNKFFFTMDDGSHGNEIWVSDGTEAGTHIPKDIRAGVDASAVGSIYAVGNDVLFSAWTPGAQFPILWKTDGTAEGTMAISESAPTPNISSLVGVSGERLFLFNAWTLWVSDKTESGTHQVLNVNPTGAGFYPNSLTDNDGTIFFVTPDETHGAELWKSDGTAEGTRMVKDINQNLGNNHFIRVLGAANGWLYFSANDDVHGFELWKTDGTEAGTTMIKDIWPGPASGNISEFNFIGNTIFFVADDGIHGYELWKSDGTEAGTVMVKDIWSGNLSSYPRLSNGYSAVIDGVLYYPADDGAHGAELWRTDGTPEGTYMMAEINPGASSSSPMEMMASEGHLFFTANDGVHGREVWHLGHQFIAFETLPDRVATDDAFEIDATASSELAVSLEVVSGPATIEGNTVRLTGSGEVVIRASQKGDHVFVAAHPVEQSFVVSKADQTITFNEISDRTTDDEPITLDGSASSGLPVVFEVSSGPAAIADNVLTINGAGTVTIIANQEGNELYNPALPVARSFEVIQIVGIEEALIKKVQVFPNPATDYLNIQISGEGEAIFTLTDSGGASVWTTLTSERNVNVPLLGYGAGLYLLKVKSNEGTLMVKIVVK